MYVAVVPVRSEKVRPKAALLPTIEVPSERRMVLPTAKNPPPSPVGLLTVQPTTRVAASVAVE